MTNYNIELMVMVPIIILLAIVDYNMQKFTSKKVFYGVNIPEKYRNFEELKHIDKSYKRGIIISTTAVLIIQIGLSLYANFTLNENLYLTAVTVPIILTVILYYFIYYSSYKKVLIFKEEHLSTINPELKSERTQILDVDFMHERDKLVKKYSLIYIIPILLVVASSAYAFINYDKIPEMMPTHFNFQGVADGFTVKTKASFFAQIGMQVVVMALVYFGSVYSLKARIKIDKNDSKSDIANTIKYLNHLASESFFMLFAMALLFSSISFGLVNQKVNQILVILSTVLLLASIVPLIYTSSKLKKGNYSDVSYTVDDDDKYWVLGCFYYNPNDPSAFVQKRFGIGWTVNLGSTKGKVLIACIVLMLVATIFISFKFAA